MGKRQPACCCPGTGVRQTMIGQDHLPGAEPRWFVHRPATGTTLSPPSSQPLLFLQGPPLPFPDTSERLLLTFLRLINPPGWQGRHPVPTRLCTSSPPPTPTLRPEVVGLPLLLKATLYFGRMKSSRDEVNDTRTGRRGCRVPGAGCGVRGGPRRRPLPPLVLGLRTERGAVIPLAVGSRGGGRSPQLHLPRRLGVGWPRRAWIGGFRRTGTDAANRAGERRLGSLELPALPPCYSQRPRDAECRWPGARRPGGPVWGGGWG